MNANAPQEWHRLFNAALNDQLDEAEKEQLTALLKSNAAARELWFLYSDLECALPEQKSPAQSANRVSKRSWFSWIPLTAAAAGVMVGLFGATVAFAYALPKPIQLGLNLINPTFEAPPSPLSPKATTGFGAWWGAGEVVSAQSSVTPTDGKQMIQFNPSEPKLASWGAMTSSAIVSQIIDLQEWKDQLRDHDITVAWAAKFNSGPQVDPRKTTFRVDLRAYSGDVSILERRYAERQEQELAHSLSKTLDDGDPSSWQSNSGKIILPPESDFLVIELKVFQADRSLGQEPSPTTRQFVDDINLSMIATPQKASAKIVLSNP